MRLYGYAILPKVSSHTQADSQAGAGRTVGRLRE